MLPPSTYLEFHLVFTLPPIALLVVAACRRENALTGRIPGIGILVIVMVAVAYTTPWDNYLIHRGVWWYGTGVTWGYVGSVPVGEYLFFALQPLLTVLFLVQLSIPTDTDIQLGRCERAVGVLGGLSVGALGAVLVVSTPSTLYLGAILLWAGPVLAIQWGFGWTHLWRIRRTVAVAVAVPTVYLWIADRIAISLGLWVISATNTVGVAPFGLPLEEATFFFVTNLFVVQGFVLYVWLLDRWPSVADSPLAARYRRYLAVLDRNLRE
ncbi:lycopene cyclase domain-containing protein [Halorubrum sp. AD140]|uniref:lycopene cyclase domain-containing protein n=1 Tax=Halorubrum sp. AD140 TaxID=3050073 RepID=UPI002ACCD2A3|nr:lycopene cyclase domain-containing protein [Halorubrum sp. AD140]MDZ5811562.1 lycopene cyclase domain-containing protein [Halorubrum sp. AD140]